MMKSTFNENLKTLRKEKGLKQKDIAIKLGVVESCYANWEQGRTEPDIKTLQQLSIIFDVTIDEMLGNDSNYNLQPVVPMSDGYTVMETFGNRLRELRTEKGKTQKEMANDINVTTPTLSHWECDYQEPSFKDLMILSKYFNVTTDYLLGLEDDFGTPTVAPMSDGYTTEERKIVNQYRQLPDKLKDIIKSQLDIFTGENENVKTTKK
jgi:transcriptional regulator with XRE-family HTH domain